MNREFNRTTDIRVLTSDLNLKVEQVFYPPHVGESDEPDVGENDPELLGAIVTKVIDGKVCLVIYQGDGIWLPTPVGELKKLIAPWTNEATDKYEYRTHPINGVELPFRSLIEENTSEPSLLQGMPGIQAWKPEGGPVLNWDNETPFTLGQLVLNPYYSSIWMYRSKAAGNNGHDPKDDFEHLFWERVGNYVGAAWEKDYYSVDETVISSNGIAYTSMIYNNNYALDAVAPPWRKSSEVVGTIPNYGYNTPYSKDDYVKTQVNQSGTIYTIVYQAKQGDNVQQFPTGDPYDLFWRTVGTFLGEYVEGQTYNQFAVVISTLDGITNIYISNKADNSDSVTAVVEEKKWQVIGEYKQSFNLKSNDIDAEGNLPVSGVGTGKRLLCAYVGDEPIDSKYYPTTKKVSGFGGWLDDNGDPIPDLNIELTFI